MPLRDASLGPAEILMSESQERMMAVVTPADVDRFLEICARWEVPATVIGEVTDTGRLEMTWHGEPVVDIPPGSAADDGPVYDRPVRRPAGQDALAADDPSGLARPVSPAELRAALLTVLAAPDAADKTWVTEQYDRYVRGDTVLAMPHDAGLIRVDEATGLGVALATDGNGRYCLLDPYAGTAAGAGRGLPERGRHRRPPAGRDQLPELRLARGPRGDVAVHRGGARGWPTAA